MPSNPRAAVRRVREAARAAAVRWGGLPHSVGTVDSPELATAGDVTSLWWRNALSRRSVVDASTDVVVTMTSHGDRVADAWVAIEAIGRGDVRPGRLVLWLEEPRRRLPLRLRRLVARGLEVEFVPSGDGVHTKYQPCIRARRAPGIPIVTSDDDIVYPREWLARLLAAYAESPAAIVAFRAHRMVVVDGEPAPYTEWPPQTTSTPSAASFGTSVSGQVLPPVLLDALRDRGDAFRALSPTADDVWIHAVAIESGVLVRQVDDHPHHFPFVPGSQFEDGELTGLNRINVHDGGNDRQIAATYGVEALALVERHGRRDADEGSRVPR